MGALAGQGLRPEGDQGVELVSPRLSPLSRLCEMAHLVLPCELCVGTGRAQDGTWHVTSDQHTLVT